MLPITLRATTLNKHKCNFINGSSPNQVSEWSYHHRIFSLIILTGNHYEITSFWVEFFGAAKIWFALLFLPNIGVPRTRWPLFSWPSCNICWFLKSKTYAFDHWICFRPYGDELKPLGELGVLRFFLFRRISMGWFFTKKRSDQHADVFFEVFTPPGSAPVIPC